jgi:hypothetical protein
MTKHPKIGQILYAASDKQNRIGETIFFCSTQCNAEKTAEKAFKEARSRLCYPEEEYWDDDTNDWKPVFDTDREKDIIIYELKRIK